MMADNPTQRLTTLKELLDNGLITQEDYDKTKAQILASLVPAPQTQAGGDDEHKRKLDQISADQQKLLARLPEPKRRRGPSPPMPDASLSSSDENEPDEYLTTTMKVRADDEMKALLTLVDTGSPKSFLITKCSQILFPLKDLEKPLKAPFGTAISVGWISGTINDSPVKFKCYLLGLNSTLEHMGYHLLLGNKALKQNGATIDASTQTICFYEISPVPAVSSPSVGQSAVTTPMTTPTTTTPTTTSTGTATNTSTSTITPTSPTNPQ